MSLAQGTLDPVVLNTVAGNPLTSQAVTLNFAPTALDPVLQLKFGFATAESAGPGVFQDSFSLTLQDEGLTLTYVLVTVDAGGPVWAPVTPGTTPISEQAMVRSPIAYPSLTPVLPQQWAYDLVVALPGEVVGRTFNLYFDLFNNDDGLPSQGWFADLTVVPEPGVWALLGLGCLLLWWRSRERSLRGSAREPAGVRAGRWESEPASGPLSPVATLPPAHRLTGPLAKAGSRTRTTANALRFLVVLLAGLAPLAASAQDRTFRLNDTDLSLAEVTPEADVYFRSMRLNRALNVWNVEVSVSNKVGRVLAGPVVLLVDGFSGATGAQQPDGTTTDGKGYFDLSALAGDGALSPGEVTAPRTLTLGRTASGSPSLTTKLFAARPPVAAALGVTRSLDEAGRPLPGVALDITGPVGATQQTSDAPSGVASFGQGPGEHLVKFSTEGYLPVWRKQTLAADRTTVLPNPRLTKRSLNPFTVTPLGGTTVSNTTGAIAIDFGAGVMSQSATVTLTPLTGQNLPAFLPQGWSPLNAFWLESSSPLQSSVTASLRPLGPISPTETAALVRWNDASLQWHVTQSLPGNGTNTLTVTLPGVGAYALVVPDTGPLAPPVAQVNQPLPASTVAMPDAAGLSATGEVTPPASPASVIPELVTGTANLVLTHATANLPSGYLLRGEVTETYLLADGSLRLTPQYEHFVVGYQRPGDQDPRTLHAAFPMRPVLLFGTDQLEEATVRVDVLPEQPFDGHVLDEGGGQVGAAGVRLLAGSGRLTGPSAIRLRRLDATVFTNLVSAAQEVVAAFDLTVDGSTLTGTLGAQLTGAPTNGLFVVARVLSEVGFYGLQPVERLQSDAQGNLSSLEPATDERLPGLRGSGQFVLVQVGEAQGLVSGVARNGQGQVQLNMPVRLTGLPWLTLTDALGRFQLVAPAGEVELGVTDPLTGDTGFVSVNIPDPQTPVGQDVGAAPAGPRVAEITPAHNATRVPRVGSVVIRFNEAVNPGTVIGNAIQLLKPDNSVVTAALTLNLRSTIATLSPAVELAANTTYRVRLAATIADPTGLPLEGQTEFSFTTVPLSTRVATAQLIIYEPGATNVPAAILDDIPAFEPGEDPFAIVVHGQPGVADPEVPVILVNESTGETQTVLSKVDGSFSSFISGTEEDFVSATFVNLNGTRVYVPVSRQEFDNGFVGLYPQGGILEAQSDGGPVRVILEPGAVETKALFRIQPLSTDQVLQAAKGTQPEEGQVVAGMKIEINGDTAERGADVSLPFDAADFELPPNQQPEDAALALAIVREIDGVVTYQVVDKLRYEEGRVFSNTFPFLGLLGFAASLSGGAAFEYSLAVLFFGTKPVIVTGNVYEERPFGGQRPLGGAYVGATPVTVRLDLDGFFKPGAVYATSGRDGSYTLVLPVDVGSAAIPFSPVPGWVLAARHPRHFSASTTEASFSGIGVGLIDRPYLARNIVFPTNTLINFGAGSASLRLNASVTPLYPPLNQPATLRAFAFSRVGTPQVTFEVQAVASTVAGQTASVEDVELQETPTLTDLGIGSIEATSTVSATKSLQAIIRVVGKAVGGETEVQEEQHLFVAFGGEDLTPPDNAPAADIHDFVGPGVIAMQPSPGSTLPHGQRVTLRFSEPVNQASVKQPGAVTIVPPPLGPPGLELSPDRQTLLIVPGRFAPGVTDFVVNVGPPLEDLSDNKFDQVPGMDGEQVFSLKLKVPASATIDVSNVGNGRGVVAQAGYIYALDAEATALKAFDLEALLLGQADPLSVTPLPGFPRDMALLPRYAYQANLQAPVKTNDLIAVVGGDAGSASQDAEGNVFLRGQYLRVFDVSDPAAPQRLLGANLTLRNTIVDRIIWRPPFLAYIEKGSDISFVGVLDFQEMLIGFNSTAEEREDFPAQGFPGVQRNNDGDYVDFELGEELPLPRQSPGALELFGKRLNLAVLDPGLIQDVDLHPSGYVGVVMAKGFIYSGEEGNQELTGTVKPSYRTLLGGGEVLTDELGIVFFGENARPKRLLALLDQPVVINGTSQNKSLALVTMAPDDDGKNKVLVIDVGDPEFPQLLDIDGIALPPELGFPQSIVRREDGLLGLSMTSDLILLDPRKVAEFPPAGAQLHPAIVGVIPGAGSGNYTLDQEPTGLNFVNLGGRSEIVRTAPRMRFVNFASAPAVVDPSLLANDLPAVEAAFGTLAESQFLTVSRVATAGGAVSSLSPPAPSVHFHVLIDAPGAAGATLSVALECLNEAGYPLRNKGKGFAPVRSMSADAVTAIKQEPRTGTDAAIKECLAYRLSDDKRSPFYNLYLSEPIVLVQEKVSLSKLTELNEELPRHVLWGSRFLRASLDASVANNAAVGIFAAEVDAVEAITRPGAFVVGDTQPGAYLLGNNPPPSGAEVSLPGTFGMVNALNGEIRHTTVDVSLPSRRMPIEFRRTVAGQNLHDGPFGPGWDFNYNQRLVELKPNTFPAGSKKPLVIRNSPDRSTIAESGDVQFVNGEGHVILFRRIGLDPIPEFSTDPLVQELGWNGGIQYLPDVNQRGVFDLLYRHSSGEFTRLTPDGMQYWYASDGRLLKIYDRYPANQHLLQYNERGELIGILDRSVEGDRFLEIAYYRQPGNLLGDHDLETDSGFVLGRIAQLYDYAGRLTTFEYSLGGVLEKRLGPETPVGVDGSLGRPVTIYLNESPVFGRVTGIVAGNGAGQPGGGNGGNALFVGTPAAGGPDGDKPVISAGSGAGGPVAITTSTDNSAENAAATDHGSTTADNASTSFGFDNFGFPNLIRMVGSILGEVEYGPTFNTNGLLAKMVYPEGNSVEYTYDPGNPVFRARANLRVIKKSAGPRGGDPGTMSAAYDNYDLRYNFPQSHTDFNNNTHTITLRSDGRDVETIDHAGEGQTKTVRNEYGQIELESDSSGVVKEYDYRTEDGFLEKSRRGALETGYGYDDSIAGKLGMPTTITPPINAGIQLTYDTRLLQTSMTRGGYQELSAYDENGNMIALTRGLGAGKVYRERRFYNQINFLERIEIDHQGETLSTVYTPDAVFRVGKETLPGNETREYTYDHLGNVRSMKVGTYEEKYERDKHGNLTSLTIGGDVVRDFDLDGYDRVEIETRKGEVDETVTRTYWPNGELKSMKVESEAGVVQDLSVSVVDAVGRARVLVMSGTAASGSQTINYTGSGSGGLVVNTIGPRDTVTETYDAAGRLDKRVSTTIGEVDFTQDDNDNLTEIKSTEDSEVYTITRGFNTLDHLESQSDNVGTLFTQTPRLDGLPITVTDSRNQISSHEYSELGRLLKLTRPEGVEFRYRFDKNLQPEFVGDKTPAGHTMSYTDGTLRLTETKLRSGAAIGFGSPDGRNHPQTITIPGGSITRTYDRLGRVLSEAVSYSGGGYAMEDATYDALDRMRSASYGGGSADNSLEFEYDPLGSLVRAKYDEGDDSYEINYGLYPDGTVSRIDYPSGPSLTIGRDNAGRLLTVAGSGSILTISSYKGVGVPAVISHGGIVQEENAYDLRKRLISRRYTRSSDGSVLADLRFQYDAGDNLLTRQHLHRAGLADVFEYDNASRLKAAGYGARPDFEGAVGQSIPGFPTGDTGLKPGLFARTYAYDAGGLDLLQSGTLANPASLPVLGLPAVHPPGFAVPPFAASISGYDGYLFAASVDGQTRSRDELGNAAGGTILYVRPAGAVDPVRQVASDIRHNGRANLIAVERPDGTEIRYHYQPSGLMHRREVEAGGSVVSDTAFVWEAGRMIEEYDLLESELRARYYYDDGDTPTAAEIRDASSDLQWYYYLRDHDYSIIGVANNLGTVVERVSYDAWGQPSIEAQDVAAPQVARIVQGADGVLLVEFTEAISPPVPLTAGTSIVASGGSFGSAISIDGTSAEVEWVEALPGHPYGTVLRVTPGQSFSSYTLQVSAGTLIDTWNNPNSAETLTVTGGSLPGTVLYPGSGNALPSTAPQRLARSAVGNPFLFHGQWFDYDTGLSYMRARWYDSFTGGFIQQDPEAYADSVSPYAGFRNSPTTLRDPSGRNTFLLSQGAKLLAEAFETAGKTLVTSMRTLVDDVPSIVAATRQGAATPKLAAGFSEMRLRWNLADSALARSSSGFEKFALKEAQMAADVRVHKDFSLVASFAPELQTVSRRGIQNVRKVEYYDDSVRKAWGFARSIGGVPRTLGINQKAKGGQLVKTIGHEGYHLESIPRRQLWGMTTRRGAKLTEEMAADLHGMANEIRTLGGELGQFSSESLRLLRQHGFKGVAWRIARDYHESAGMGFKEAYNHLLRQDWSEYIRSMVRYVDETGGAF